MSPDASLPRLLLVTDRRRARGGDLVRAALEAVRGGVRWIQLREKDLPDEAVVDLVRRLRDGAPPDLQLTLNGRPRLARVLGLGLHLPAGAALPPGAAELDHLGRSAHDDAELAAALRDPVRYVLAGTVYPTESKPGHPGDGLMALRHLVAAAAGTPLLAIGGITIPRVPEVLRAGAHGVAVCGAILAAPDPRRAAQGFGLALTVAGAAPPRRD